jgi:hypothetical protein
MVEDAATATRRACTAGALIRCKAKVPDALDYSAAEERRVSDVAAWRHPAVR